MYSFTLCGVRFSKMNARTAARRLTGALKKNSTQSLAFTPNISILKRCKGQKSCADLINRADIILPDGAGVALLAKLSGHGHIPRITGIDMGHFLLGYCAKSHLNVYLLGGKRGVAERAAKKLVAEFPTLKICGVHHGYFDRTTSSYQNRDVVEQIRAAAPALLIVCMGNPRQERWIIDNMASLPSVRLFMGLGGSLDVWSGDVRRAPLALRVLDLEWLWRKFQNAN